MGGFEILIGTMEEYLSRYKIIGNTSPFEVKRFGRKHLSYLFNTLDYKIGAEIGVDLATYSNILCKRMPTLKLYCIDPWSNYDVGRATPDLDREIIYKAAKEALERFNVRIIRKYSMEAVNEFGDNSLDFVYIDGDHRYSFVKEDLIEWGKKVRPGGIISGHDYYSRRPDVLRAVGEYTKETNIERWFITDISKPSSYFWMKLC
jgi:hypothetical protein